MIEVEQLRKTYGSTCAIEDVTFSAQTGEVLGFLGPNGAGKTTTMRILTGYLPATSGTARIAGFEVHENSLAVRQRIGYLPERPPLYPEMTVAGFLEFVARIKRVSAGDRSSRVQYAIDRCNLNEKRNVLIRKLSKGFQQRVGIAQAIVHDPPVLILDEPTVGLDPKQVIDVRNLIKSLATDHTVILSTHILPEASMVCDRVVIIVKGRIVAVNTPKNLTLQSVKQNYDYELVTDGQFEAVQAQLLALPEVEKVEKIELPQMSTDQTRLRVMSQGNRDIAKYLAQAIVNQGLGLYELKRVEGSLEDAFLQLTADTIEQEE